MRALWLLLCLLLAQCSAKRLPIKTHIGYVSYRQCLSTQIAVKRFCTHPRLQKSPLKCTIQLINAFALQLSRKQSQRKEVKDVLDSVTEDVRVQTGCRLIFYTPSEVVKDGIEDKSTIFLQDSPPVHLDRLDQRRLPLNEQFYWNATGQGVTVFLLDSGIRREHIEFRHLGSKRFRVFSTRAREESNKNNNCLEHGTQVASVVGGALNGVAKRVTIVDVSSIPCHLSKMPLHDTLSILDGLRFVDSNARKFSPAILLLPFHFRGVDPGVEDMIERIVGKNVLVITSSGNKEGSCAFTPARRNDVLTVGASNLKDGVMNKGDTSCIDVFAPGQSIRAASGRSKAAFRTTEGSSFAAAIVTGVAATILESNAVMSPELLKAEILVNYTTKAVSSLDGKEKLPIIQSLTSAEKKAIKKGVEIEEDVPQLQPGFSVQPLRPAVINLFKNTTEASKNLKLQILNYGKGELSWGMAFEGVQSDASLTWMQGTVMNGTLSAGKRTEVNVHFTSTFDSPGLYQAFISMHSNDPKLNSLRIPIEIRIFCQHLQMSNDRYEITIEEAKFFESRPKSWNPSALIESSDVLYVEAVLIFSQPVTLWDLAEVSTDGFCTVEYSSLLNAELCGRYKLHMTKKRMDVWEGVNTFCISIPDDAIFDIHGRPFPKQKTCVSHDAKPRSRIYGSFLAVTNELPPKTTDSDVLLILAFSESVIGFNASSLTVTEGRITSVIPGDPSEISYFVRLQLEKDYYGSVSVSLPAANITDATGNPLVDDASITFERIASLRLQPAVLHFEIVSDPSDVVFRSRIVKRTVAI